MSTFSLNYSPDTIDNKAPIFIPTPKSKLGRCNKFDSIYIVPLSTLLAISFFSSICLSVFNFYNLKSIENYPINGYNIPLKI